MGKQKKIVLPSAEKIFFYNVGNIAKTIFPEFQRKYLKCADPCGQHVEIGIFDSVISTFFIVRILRNV